MIDGRGLCGRRRTVGRAGGRLGGRAGDGLGNLGELQRPLDAAAAQHDQAAGRGGSGDGLPSGQGGDFGGGGASGDWGSTADAGGSWADNISLDGVDLGGDEGALVVVPILAVFAGLVAAFFGFGALLWLYFGVDVLLSVAVELAFSMMAARALVRVERAGWLLAAVRLTWKPLLGALVCAVALGTLADWWVPEANTLREVLAHVRGKG